MKRFNVYRAASVLLLVFCFMHTAGGMFGHASHGAFADAVLESMKRVRFPTFGVESTWYGLYFGFGLTVSVFQLFAAAACWWLGGVAPEQRPLVAPIAWATFVSMVALAVLSWVYFFPPPGVFATAIALLTGIGALKTRPGVDGSATAALGR